MCLGILLRQDDARREYPNLRGSTHLTITLAQHLVDLSKLALVVVLTLGALMSKSAQGSAWGLARALRLEHVVWRARITDAPRGAGAVGFWPLVPACARGRVCVCVRSACGEG